MLIKIISGITFLVIALSIALILNFISSFFERYIFNKLNSKIRYLILMFLSILFEVFLVSLLAFKSDWSFIDAWFTGSILLLSITWLPNYFRPFHENASKTLGKFNGGNSTGRVTVSNFNSNSPFIIGTLMFCFSGLIVSIISYLPYII